MFVAEETVTVGGVLFLLALISALGGLWWRIDARIRAGDQEADRRLREVERDIAQARLDTAEKYMTKISAGAAIERVLDEIKGLRADMRETMKSIDERMQHLEQIHMRGDAGGR